MSFVMVVLEVHFFGKWVHINHRGNLGSVQTTFLVFLVFFRFQISLQHIWQCSDLQWRKQWDAGSRGSLLKNNNSGFHEKWVCRQLQACCTRIYRHYSAGMKGGWLQSPLRWPFPISVSLESTSERQTIPFSSTGRAEGSSPHCFIWTAMSNR